MEQNSGMGSYSFRYFSSFWILFVMQNIAKSIAASLNVKSERGVTAIEYGLLAALIALAIITAVTLVGTNLTTTFNTIATKV